MAKETQMTQGKPVIKIDPNKLTIVDSKHELAPLLYLSRNKTEYQANSATVKSFIDEGQLQPIGVFPFLTKEGQKQLVVAFGNQRTLKARAGNVPVDAVVFDDWTPDDAERAMAIENTHRTDLSLPDLLRSVQRAIARHKAAKTKNVYGTVALEFNRGSHEWARGMERVANLPKEILKFVGDGPGKTVPLATALEIAKAEGAEAQLELYNTLIKDEANLSQKGGLKVTKAASHRAQKDPKDTLTSAEWRLIAANESLNLTLTDDEARLLIAAVLGDKGVKECQDAGLSFVKHQAKPVKEKKVKGKAPAPKKKVVDVENLNFEDEEEETEEDDE